MPWPTSTRLLGTVSESGLVMLLRVDGEGEHVTAKPLRNESMGVSPDDGLYYLWKLGLANQLAVSELAG